MLNLKNRQTPLSAGYYMPAEWVEHELSWMAWPHDPIAWRGRHHEAKKAIADLASTIARFEPVRMLVPHEDLEEARKLCSPGVEILPFAVDDAWTRDTAPSFLVNDQGYLAGVNWRFNGWGEMDFAHIENDRSVALRLCEELAIPCFSAPLVNEGGAIHVDGEGTVLCTEATLLDEKRNPVRSKEEVEEILVAYLGAKKVLWLERGYEQDETGGHIDIIASFAAPGVVMHLWTDDPQDPNYRIFSNNVESLEQMTDARGRSLKVVKMPQPGFRFDPRWDRRISLSYQNYYFVNGALIVPVFGDDNDEKALEIFRNTFPQREIVPFKANQIFYGGGGVHCVTQQQPRIDQ